jgi:cytochrome c
LSKAGVLHRRAGLLARQTTPKTQGNPACDSVAIAYQAVNFHVYGKERDPIPNPYEDIMTKFTLAAGFAALVLAGPALAADPAAGEAEFKKCKACHAIVASDGTEVVKGGKTGPNLGGIVGRPVASVADFNYGESLLAVGAAGAVWDEASLAAYITDPVAWLKEKTGDAAAKSKMSFKLAKGAEDMAAYLATIQ